MMRRHATNILASMAAAMLRTRWLVRAPIVLYRARLGFVLGSHLLMLEHIGRTTKARRYVVLEVIDRPSARRYVVASGFGEHAQWLRNITADPRVHVSVAGRIRVPGTARRLDAQAAAECLARYSVAHPRAWSTLRPVLEQTLGASIDADGADIPLVALDLDA